MSGRLAVLSILLLGTPALASAAPDAPALALRGLFGKREAPRPPPTLHELTADDLDRMVAELAPVVAEAAGRPFVSVPHARLGTPTELERIVEGEARLVLGDIYDAPEHVIERMVGESAASVPGILGKYGLETKVLYLSTQAVAQVVALGPFADDEALDVARLVLAHELVHALQDQVVDMMPLFTGRPDLDALNALRATTEGHANLVEERVAARLGLDDLHDRMNASQGWGPDGVLRHEAWPIWAIYGQGRNFVHHHAEQGGDDRVWTLLAEPPNTTAPVFRPERYGVAPAAEVDPGVLDGIEQLLTSGPWTTVSSRLGEYDLRFEAQRVPAERLDAALSHLVGGRSLHAVRPDRDVDVRVLVFDDPAHARDYVALIREQARAASERPTGGLGLAVTVADYDGVPSDLAIERVLAPAGSGASALERRSVWVVRGASVVQIGVRGFRPGRRMQTALVEVFERLDATAEPPGAR